MVCLNAFRHGAVDDSEGVCCHRHFGGGSGRTLGAMSRAPDFWTNAVHRNDVSDDRRTAESVLAIEADEFPDVVAELAKSKRLSVVMGNLNRLMQHPIDQELGRRALRHLGFLDD
jgi:hypothetical protein